MADAVEFRLLGPLEVAVGSGIHEVSSPRQRMALSMLLLHASQVVPFGQLIDAVWPERPPPTARSQLQTCISGLRRQLARVRATAEIITRPVGYMLTVRDDGLDIERFERMVVAGRGQAANGQLEEAVLELRTALALWRGPAAAGVESAAAQAIATRLNENRIGVLEECIDLELALGRHRDLAGELSELVREYPTREKLRAQHMLCLYRSARPADALESFRQARQIFTEELGLDPGAELRGLERAILASDKSVELEPALGMAPLWPDRGGLAVPRQLPTAIADFAGRQDLQRELTRLLAAGPDGTDIKYLPIVVLSGKSGVGKTALALQVAHAIRAHYPDGQLFAELGGAAGKARSADQPLGQFLRALGPPAGLPAGLAEQIAAYRTALGDRRVLIVLDDVSSTAQVLPVLPGNPDCAVIVTSRDPLVDLPGARHVEVGSLDLEASTELLAKIIGPDRVQAEPSAARAIACLCGHLPLALRIAATKLAKRPHWRLEELVRRMADDDRRLDELTLGGVGVRAALMLSYQELDVPARQLFMRLSLLGSADFAAWVSAPLLDRDVRQAADLLDALVEARLVEVQTFKDRPPRFRLDDLARICAAEQLALAEPVTERFSALRRLLRCWLSLTWQACRRHDGWDHRPLPSAAMAWDLPAELMEVLLENPLGWLRAERPGLVAAILQAGQALLISPAEAAGQAEAAGYLHAALELFELIGDQQGRALTLGLLARIDRHNGRYDQALARCADVPREVRQE